MTELLNTSRTRQLLAYLAGLLRGSLCALLLRKLRQSRLGQAVGRALTGPPLAARSMLGRLGRRCSRRLWALGRGPDSAAGQSLVCRALDRIWALFRESLLLGPLLQGGLLGWLLTILGLFGVADWLLRDVLAVPVLSSVWDELLLLLGLWLLLRRAVRQTAPLPSRVSSLSFPLLQFFAVCAALFLVTLGDCPDVSILGLRATCQSIVWFPLLLRLLRDENDVARVCRCMILAAFVIALHGIWQYIVAAPIPEHWTDTAEQAVRTRAFSIFGSPNILGDFMVLAAPLTLGAAYAERGWRRIALLGMTGCMLLCCLFTMSRGAWLGLFAAALVFSLLCDRRLLALLLGGILLAFTLPFVRSRISYLFTDAYARSASLGGRSLRWTRALGYLYGEGAGLTGLGFGRYGGAVAAQHPLRADWEYAYVDNYYVKILAENGWMGLISYLLLLLGLVWSGLRSWAANRGARRRPLCAGMLAGLCGVMVHCWFENIFEEPYMLAWFWIVAAMMVFLGQPAQHEA